MTKNLVKFNANGDPPGRYTVYQFQKKSNNKYGYIPIGNWTTELQMDLSLAKWKNGSTQLPMSVCSEPCPSGSVKSSEGICCWTCIPCDEDEVGHSNKLFTNSLFCTPPGFELCIVFLCFLFTKKGTSPKLN